MDFDFLIPLVLMVLVAFIFSLAAVRSWMQFKRLTKLHRDSQTATAQIDDVTAKPVARGQQLTVASYSFTDAQARQCKGTAKFVIKPGETSFASGEQIEVRYSLEDANLSFPSSIIQRELQQHKTGMVLFGPLAVAFIAFTAAYVMYAPR